MGRAVGGLNICKYSPPKAYGGSWISLLPCQVMCTTLHHLVDNVWECFGAMDALKSVAKEIKGGLNGIVAKN